MNYLIKIKYTKQLDNGLLNSVTEPYIITNVDRFTEAESAGMKLIEDYALLDADITHIQRIKLDEVFYDCTDDCICMATIMNTITKDDGSEQQLKLDWLVSAVDVNDAIKKVNEYIETDMRDLSLEKIKKTKIVEII
jgi:hypothetical protein